MYNRNDSQPDFLGHTKACDFYINIDGNPSFNVSAIKEYAKLGAQLTLGGTGIIGLRDTEDAHLLETAIAGRADFLAVGWVEE
jgi:hypothetical protein